MTKVIKDVNQIADLSNENIELLLNDKDFVLRFHLDNQNDDQYAAFLVNTAVQQIALRTRDKDFYFPVFAYGPPGPHYGYARDGSLQIDPNSLSRFGQSLAGLRAVREIPAGDPDATKHTDHREFAVIIGWLSNKSRWANPDSECSPSVDMLVMQVILVDEDSREIHSEGGGVKLLTLNGRPPMPILLPFPPTWGGIGQWNTAPELFGVSIGYTSSQLPMTQGVVQGVKPSYWNYPGTDSGPERPKSYTTSGWGYRPVSAIGTPFHTPGTDERDED